MRRFVFEAMDDLDRPAIARVLATPAQACAYLNPTSAAAQRLRDAFVADAMVAARAAGAGYVLVLYHGSPVDRFPVPLELPRDRPGVAG